MLLTVNPKTQIPSFSRKNIEMWSEKWIPHLLCAIVGISAWIEINGLFSELGLLKALPEGYGIASILVIIVQIGNLVPLCFSMLPKKPKLPVSMVIVLSIGISSLVFLACLWDQTAHLFGKERSLLLYIGTFLAAGADCLSNIVFWPYVGQFPQSYITAMGTGESLSSAVSAIVATTQKAIGFSPSVFFVVLTVIVLCCSTAFAVLERKYAADLKEQDRNASDVLPKSVGADLDETTITETPVIPEPSQPVWKSNLPALAIIAGIAFVQNGLNTSLLPYACKGYPNAHFISQNALFVAAPMMSISASFFKPRKSMIPAIMIWIATSIFIIVAASLPNPILSDPNAGTGLMASVAILSGSSLAYSKVSAMLLLRCKKAPTGSCGKEFMKSLMTSAGTAMQIGSVLGAATMFSLVQAGVFPSYKKQTL
jgi:riboflavin transporter 2